MSAFKRATPQEAAGVGKNILAYDGDEDEDDDTNDDDENENGDDDGDDEGDLEEAKDELGEEEEEEEEELIESLSPEEVARIKRIYTYCDRYGEGLDPDQVCNALSLLGQVTKIEEVHNYFEEQDVDRCDLEDFTKLIATFRAPGDSDELMEEIEQNFNALYQGTCPNDDQKDEAGKRFLTSKALRQVLTTMSDKLTDEEAEELLSECQIQWVEREDGRRIGKIYLEQYRAMLLDPGA